MYIFATVSIELDRNVFSLFSLSLFINLVVVIFVGLVGGVAVIEDHLRLCALVGGRHPVRILLGILSILQQGLSRIDTIIDLVANAQIARNETSECFASVG